MKVWYRLVTVGLVLIVWALVSFQAIWFWQQRWPYEVKNVAFFTVILLDVLAVWVACHVYERWRRRRAR